MPSQDLILPLLLRIAPPLPLTQHDLAGVKRISKRPVVDEEWDRKQPTHEDSVFDPLLHPDHRQQRQAQAEAQTAEAEVDTEPATSSAESEPSGHIDTFA